MTGVDFTPMNFQLMVPKSTEVQSIQQNRHTMVNAQQEMQTANARQETEIKEQTVLRRDESEDGKIKDDPEREARQGGQGGQRRRRSREFKDEDEILAELARLRAEGKNLDIARGSLVDISM